MERIPAGLFLIHLSIVCSSPQTKGTSTEASQSISNVVPIREEHTWDSAKAYCEEHHGGLVTIRNMDDSDSVLPYEGWIGLHRPDGIWQWSNGEKQLTFTQWKDNSDDADKNCALKHCGCKEWEAKNCEDEKSFICYEDDMILVEVKKTWEEALVHCRKFLSPKGEYDLASEPEEDTDIPYNTEVWVGLRFLAGEWWWMNGERPDPNSLPSCPEPQQYCGAMVSQQSGWTVLNCSEKRFFLCRKN